VEVFNECILKFLQIYQKEADDELIVAIHMISTKEKFFDWFNIQIIEK